MDPLLLALALVALVIALLIARPLIRRRVNRMLAERPQKLAERLHRDAHTLGTGLAFADHIAGRSIVARELEGKRLATPLAQNTWRIGLEDVGGVDLEWATHDGIGVLRPTRTRTIAATLAGAGNWERVLAKVDTAAGNEGAAVSRVHAGPFVDSGERVGGEQVWVRPAV